MASPTVDFNAAFQTPSTAQSFNSTPNLMDADILTPERTDGAGRNQQATAFLQQQPAPTTNMGVSRDLNTGLERVAKSLGEFCLHAGLC